MSRARSNEDKAIAVWKFIQQITEVGSPPKEPAYGNYYVISPKKLLNVYGYHWCDGLSRIMTMTWRALGYRAEKLYKFGHTLADCWWIDTDGIARWHVFDVSQHWFVYNRSATHIATPNELALDFSLLVLPSRTPIPSRPSYMQPCYVHAGHLKIKNHDITLNLRDGERVKFLWGNIGKPYYDQFGHKNRKDFEHGPYQITYGNGILMYDVPISKGEFFNELDNYTNLTCRDGSESGPRLHPKTPRKVSEAIIPISLPYVISDAFLSASIIKKNSKDQVAFSISTDRGKTWRVIWDSEDKIGKIELNRLDFCPRFNPKTAKKVRVTTPFGRYDFLLKVTMIAHERSTSCGLELLKISVVFQHNLFALPMLLPGNNIISIGGKLASNYELKVTYEWYDSTNRLKKDTRYIKNLPASYNIFAPAVNWKDVVCRCLELSVKRCPRSPRKNATRLSSTHGRKNNLPVSISAMKMIGRRYPRYSKVVSFHIDHLKGLLDREKKCAKGNANELKRISSEIWKTVAILEAIRSPKAGKILEKVIRDDVSHPYRNKEIACQALYHCMGKASVPILMKILRRSSHIKWCDYNGRIDEDTMWLHTVQMATAVLSEIGDFDSKKEAADIVSRILIGKCTGVPLRKIWRGKEIEWGLIKALGKLGSLKHAKVLYKYLDEGSDASAVAILALMELNDRSVIPKLLDLLRTFKYSPIGLYSIRAIGNLGSLANSEVLYKFLNYWDEDFRGETVIALRKLKDVNSLPRLKEMRVRETHPWVLAELAKTISILEKETGEEKPCMKK